MKYELTGEQHPTQPELHRIRALRDIPAVGVRAGDPGGWVQSETNLSQTGDAWVSGNAQVYGRAQASGDAQVSGDARVSGDAQVYGDAQVSGDAWVYANARVYGDARVTSADHVLTAGPLSSEGNHGTLTRQDAGHLIAIGCWSGTVDQLRALAASDRWPSGCDAETRERYAPRLLAFAALCEAQIDLWEGQTS